MEIASVGSSANLHLLERYPELLFLLSYTSFTPLDRPIRTEVDCIPDRSSLDEVDILYVYGVGYGEIYVALKDWLKERAERRLIFLDDELAAIHALLESEHAEDLLRSPQVIVHFLSKSQQLDGHLEGLVASYPSDRIEIILGTSVYQKRKKRRFQQIRLKLLRQSAVSHALLTEALYSHKLLGNLLRNIKRWPGSFLAGGLKGKFRGIPAIICGAGPSLEENMPLLKQLEDSALIIAGGSTIAALSNQGVHPHLGIALDPNREEFGRLKIASAYEMPLIYATRLQPDVFNVINGERGYLISGTGGPCEQYFERQMDIEGEPIGPALGPEALSVTTIAIAIAVEMGCNPILLNGIDLAYTGMQRYAAGVLPSSDVHKSEIKAQKKASERCLKRKDIHGHYVHTLVKWVMESECIASFAKQHPQTRFINVSRGGIGFSGISNRPLAEVAQEELIQLGDLRSLVHAEIQQLNMPQSKEKIVREMQEVGESLLRLGSIAEQMIEELEKAKDLLSLAKLTLPTGKMTILEIDFQEEKAFECLFPTLGPALDKLLARAFCTLMHCTEEEQHRYFLESKMAKWKQWKEMIDSEIAVFRENG